ncbi:RxLR effector protein [Phytophthora megakarya]|uniref:RxLR effector protein n=1 Tax=Phytophthora megakarya TaxID=4795 RepID=A0A225VLZ2_9STRA|nr:RxLR effector protein [Phytophthora megakarya]
MCVYLAPRWRRRSSPLLVMIVLALATLTVQGRTMTGSGSGAVQQQEVGVVTTDTTQSTTTVNKAWNSTDSSQPCEQKSVSFDSLVKTTTAPIEQSTEQPKSFSSSASASMDHEILTPKSTGSSSDSSCEGKRHHASDDSTKQDDDDGSFDDNEKDESDDSHAGKMNHTTIFKPNEKAINKISTVNKTATLPQVTPAPTPKTPGPTLPTTAASVHVLPPNPGTFEAKPTDWTSNSGSDKSKSWSNSGSNDQSVEGQSYEDTNSAKALENKTKSASLATSSRALDQTLVVVIVGVVGAIGALLMFVSRKVLKETGDDKDLEDTSIF